MDSCRWLECYADDTDTDADADAGHRGRARPAGGPLTLFEVFKRILQQRTEADALHAAALMRQGRVVALSDTLALGAARLSFDLGLGQASTMLDALQSMQRTA